MRIRLFWLLTLSIPVLATTALAEETFPVISANGFSCSQSNEMVTCRGNFPSQATPTLEITGQNVVWIRGDYPSGRYTYYSDSGCLCSAEFETGGKVKSQECTSRQGEKKSFKGGKSTYDWCKKN